VKGWLERRRVHSGRALPRSAWREDGDDLVESQVIPVVCIEYGGVAKFSQMRIMPELHQYW
jgi:hypothetical protein